MIEIKSRYNSFALKLLTLGALAACAPSPDPNVTVRHFGSTEYHGGAQFRLFTFDPNAARTLDDRIRLARAEIARDPACRWGDAPRSVIEEATRRQGARYAETLLAAPVICET